jgi:hypothetical protein
MRKATLALAVATGLLLSGGANAARFVINNVDPPGTGFNDPTPATPVGGNPGTTVGEQRRIAFAYALQIWGNTLESSVPIVVQGTFRPRACTATSGVLASAGTLQIFANFRGAPLANHWYHAPLSNALIGRDLTPGKTDPGYLLPPYNDDIFSAFNSELGKPGCLTGSTWYYGLDNGATGTRIDFLNTFLHEVAHGLGFSNFAAEGSTTDTLIEGLPDVYMANTRDLTTGKQWNTMTPAEIVASAVNDGKVVWTGPAVTGLAPTTLAPYQGLRLTGGVSQELTVQLATFGPAPSVSNFNGQVQLARAAASGAESNGCTASGALASFAGKVALISRGACTFTEKTKNAQDAGASAVLIYNNAATGLPGMGGSDATIIIPAVGISQADGNAIKAAAAPVNVEYFLDLTRPPIGTARDAGSGTDYVRLYAPTVYAAGSSVSHFDTIALPNLIMEPAISADLKGATNLDLTPAVMKDIGWSLAAGAGNVAIWACDTTVPKASDGGKQLSTAVTACAASANNNGQLQSCVVQAANHLLLAGLISSGQQGSIASCAAGN